jgi:hypothetical protein
MPRRVRLRPGVGTKWIEVPAADAQRLIRDTARLVADLPRDGSSTVVWRSGASELLVETDQLTLTCNAGLVTVGIPIGCDQLDGRAVVTVPFAVGARANPRGLFMATFATPTGPSVVIDVWADALTAFAWEALLTLAQRLAAAAGTDRRRRALVPVAIGAQPRVLLVQPMARHEG